MSIQTWFPKVAFIFCFSNFFHHAHTLCHHHILPSAKLPCSYTAILENDMSIIIVMMMNTISYFQNFKTITLSLITSCFSSDITHLRIISYNMQWYMQSITSITSFYNICQFPCFKVMINMINTIFTWGIKSQYLWISYKNCYNQFNSTHYRVVKKPLHSMPQVSIWNKNVPFWNLHFNPLGL